MGLVGIGAGIFGLVGFLAAEGRRKPFSKRLFYCWIIVTTLMGPYSAVVMPILMTAIDCYGIAALNISPLCDINMDFEVVSESLKEACAACTPLINLLR